MQTESVLVLGHQSFAARGLVERLQTEGYRVFTFTRGEPRRLGDEFCGSALGMELLFELQDKIEFVVNFIVLKNDSVEHNIAFMRQLLKLCEHLNSRRLIHISSASVYPASAKTISESTEIESDPSQKGVYGAWKVAAEGVLLNEAPRTLMVSLVRPGFILGSGLLDPIVGNAVRLPGGAVLLLGNGTTELPVTSRPVVFTAISRILSLPPEARLDRLLLAHPHSPARREFVAECVRELGVGSKVWELPVPVWLAIGVGAEAVAGLLGKRSMKPWLKIKALCSEQHYVPDGSAETLGVPLAFDWRTELNGSLEHQDAKVKGQAAASPANWKPEAVSLVGYGRIAQSRHVPALSQLGLSESVKAFDKAGFVAADGVDVRPLAEHRSRGKELVVICTPGSTHVSVAQAMALSSDSRLLVEKPLATRLEDLAAWEAISRSNPVFVGHNYRFKSSVLQMLAYLAAHNPGMLQRVVLEFQSPPVTYDGALWLRNERSARTLLLDYSLHFLDLATMFSKGPWVGGGERVQIDAAGQTHLIEGTARSPEYAVSYLLRQGFGRKTASLDFVYENYSINLSFFPDTFNAVHGSDGPVPNAAQFLTSSWSLAKKISSRLRGRTDDHSHVRLYDQALSEVPEATPIHLSNLLPFYTFILGLAERVYGGEVA